ncbi:jg23510 [Pararge aegeria aegeria]|uniref:Jg23510 protein n=1 Tax=Pararge aegeria aegeria TaxID=348720 RepID=A0A8S4QU18_9NEOP|nr:jg23510 [Pararge aegeria aegeria]
MIPVSLKRRIHSAIVSGVNQESRSVTVEWYERGETKGKEVEIDAILALNPELVGTRQQTPHLQPMPNRLARDMTRQSIPVATKGMPLEEIFQPALRLRCDVVFTKNGVRKTSTTKKSIGSVIRLNRRRPMLRLTCEQSVSACSS